MKGDRIEVVVDVGDGTRSYEISATQNGRRVEVSNARGVLEVSEVTRNGTQVRAGRFMATRVVAVIEYPAADERRATHRKRSADQPSLL